MRGVMEFESVLCSNHDVANHAYKHGYQRRETHITKDAMAAEQAGLQLEAQ